MFPVTITLSNISELTAVMAALGHKHQEVAAAPVEKSSTSAATTAGAARSPRTAAAAAETAAPAKTAAESAPSAANAEAAPQASTAAPDVAYADLQKVILKLHAKDPSATQAIAKSMGLDNFKPLKDDADSTRRADAKARIEAKLAELGA